MTRSIFDPSGGETEQTGGRNLGPAADNDSHLPTDIVDGNVSDEDENLAAGQGQLQSAMPASALGTQTQDQQRQAPPAP